MEYYPSEITLQKELELELDLPPASIPQLNQLYLLSIKELNAGKPSTDIDAMASLRNLILDEDYNIANAACKYTFQLLTLMKERNAVDYPVMLDTVSKKTGPTKTSGIVIDYVLTAISDQFSKESKNQKSTDPTVYLDMLTSFLYSCPDKAYIYLNHFEHQEVKVLKRVYGSLLVKLLFDEIPLTNFHSRAFWNLLSKHKILIYPLIMWIKSNDVEKLVHMYSLYPAFRTNKEFSALFLSRLFGYLCYTGFDPWEMKDDLTNALTNVSDVIQSLICTYLAFNFRECATCRAPDYIRLCIFLVENGNLFKEVVQLLKVELLLYSIDYSYFSDIKDLIYDLNDVIDRNLPTLESVKNPVITDMCSRFVIKRYNCLSEAFEVLKLLNSFHCDSSNFLKWVNRVKIYDCKCIHSKVHSILYSLLIFGELSVKEDIVDIIFKLNKKHILLIFYMFYVESNPSMKAKIFSSMRSLDRSTFNEEERDLYRVLILDLNSSSANIKADIMKTMYLTKELPTTDSLKNLINSTKENAIERLTVLKRLASNCDIIVQSEAILLELNTLLDHWILNPDASYLISLIVDCISVLISRNALFVESLYNAVLDIVDVNTSECVLKSFCRFLSMLPSRLALREATINNIGILSKSVHILWDLITEGSTVTESAIEALCCYSLEHFDRALLTCEHINDSGPQDSMFKGAIPEICWLHLLLSIKKDDCIFIFTRLVRNSLHNRNYLYFPKNNYASLFRAIFSYITEAMADGIEYFDPKNEPLTDICLKLLTEDWSVSSEKYTPFYDFFEKCDDVSIQKTIFKILLRNYACRSASDVFEQIITGSLLKPEHMPTLYFYLVTFSDHFLGNEVLEKIISEGLDGLFKEQPIPASTIVGPLLDHDVNQKVKRTILCHTLRIWKDCSYGGEVYSITNGILAKYSPIFLSSLPIYSVALMSCQKYIDLFTSQASSSKKLSDFKKCIEFATVNPRLKPFVLNKLISLLEGLGVNNVTENRHFIFYAASLTDKGDNFCFSLLALCLDRLTGKSILAQNLTVQSAIDHFPANFAVHFKNSPAVGTDHLICWSRKTILHPIIREAVKLAFFHLYDTISSPRAEYSKIVDLNI